MSVFFCFSEVCLRCRLVLPLFCRRCPAGRCAFLVSGCHCLPLAFLPHIPPPALAERSSPAGKGEIYSYLMQGAPPLASPGGGLNPRGTGLSRCSDCLGWHFPWNRHKRRPNNRFIREKFWGVWGTLSRVPQRFPASLASAIRRDFFLKTSCFFSADGV